MSVVDNVRFLHWTDQCSWIDWHWTLGWQPQKMLQVLLRFTLSHATDGVQRDQRQVCDAAWASGLPMWSVKSTLRLVTGTEASLPVVVTMPMLAANADVVQRARHVKLSRERLWYFSKVHASHWNVCAADTLVHQRCKVEIICKCADAAHACKHVTSRARRDGALQGAHCANGNVFVLAGYLRHLCKALSGGQG